MKNTLLKSFLLLSSLLATQSQASVVYERFEMSGTNSSFGGYDLVDFDMGTSYTQSIGGVDYLLLDSPIDGSALSFNTKQHSHSDDSTMVHELDVSAASDVGWWNNYESFDYDVFTTSDHWIEILMPKNTLAFSFNVGADIANGSGWFNAIDNKGNSFKYGDAGFNANGNKLGVNYSPGYGIYADNSNASAGNCTYVSSVIVDPNYVWGVGNFSIAQGNCSSNVPEPSILALMSFGLIGIGLVRRKMK